MTKNESGAAILYKVAGLLDKSTYHDWPKITLGAVVDARRQLDELEASAVRDLRLRGESWADIADVLGVSRQAAQQRFAGRL